MSTNKCLNCTKTVRNNQRGIFCDICRSWCHLSCTSLSISDYNNLASSPDDWFCHNCLSKVFPFNSLHDDTDYANAVFNLAHSQSFSLNYIRSSQQLSVISKHIGSNDDIDPDSNFLASSIKNSPYFMNDEFNDFIRDNSLTDRNFSILHINARSLTCNMDNLLLLLSNINLVIYRYCFYRNLG